MIQEGTFFSFKNLSKCSDKATRTSKILFISRNKFLLWKRNAQARKYERSWNYGRLFKNLLFFFQKFVKMFSWGYLKFLTEMPKCLITEDLDVCIDDSKRRFFILTEICKIFWLKLLELWDFNLSRGINSHGKKAMIKCLSAKVPDNSDEIKLVSSTVKL